MSTSHIIQPLIESLQKKRCVLFVGSGLSTAAGFPSWPELIHRLVEEAKVVPKARTEGLEKLIAANDLLVLANFARWILGKPRFFEIVSEIFDRDITFDQIPRVHKVIVSTDYRAFITTNYDRLIESAFVIQRLRHPKVLTPDSIAGLANALYRPDPFILKLHGDIAASESLVLTEDDYDRLTFQSPHVRLFMHALSLSYALLFAGYSLKDPDFRLILKELNLTFQGYAPPRYAFVPNATEVEIDQLMEMLKIQVIPYRPDNNHQELVQLLEELQQVAPYR
jgi:hypothetical protein